MQVGGQILARYEAGQWRYLLADGLGSVRVETDAQGQAVVERRFDPYGKPLVADGGTPFGYTGEPWEAFAGLL